MRPGARVVPEVGRRSGSCHRLQSALQAGRYPKSHAENCFGLSPAADESRDAACTAAAGHGRAQEAMARAVSPGDNGPDGSFVLMSNLESGFGPSEVSECSLENQGDCLEGARQGTRGQMLESESIRSRSSTSRKTRLPSPCPSRICAIKSRAIR